MADTDNKIRLIAAMGFNHVWFDLENDGALYGSCRRPGHYERVNLVKIKGIGVVEFEYIASTTHRFIFEAKRLRSEDSLSPSERESLLLPLSPLLKDVPDAIPANTNSETSPPPVKEPFHKILSTGEMVLVWQGLEYKRRVVTSADQKPKETKSKVSLFRRLFSFK